MNAKSIRWFRITVLLPLLTSAGCRAEQASPKRSEAATPAIAAETAGAEDQPFVRTEHLQTVYFARNQWQLDVEQKKVLKSYADWLKENPPLNIRVEGYSDSRGTPEQSSAMSLRRAAAIGDFYVALGIPRSRLSIASLGQENPTCFESSEDCWSKNRRAETLIENRSVASMLPAHGN